MEKHNKIGPKIHKPNKTAQQYTSNQTSNIKNQIFTSSNGQQAKGR